jgi:RNA polymerase sigma factor (sigma-70 family)
MAELSQADRFLLEGIRRADADSWSHLVDRFRGRLFAFAQSRLRSSHDAEDVVQETFMTFLKGMNAFRGEAGLETYLFTLLRRRVADYFRARGRKLNVCLLHDVVRPEDEGDTAEPMARVPSPDPSASWYVRRREQDDVQREALAGAIRSLINGYKKSLNFRDLKIVEMLFYCQLANKEAAKVAHLGEKQIALIKHRCLKKVRENVSRLVRSRGMEPATGDAPAASEAMLSETWEALRLSCPKRSTVGAYLLETLEDPWRDYVDFHLHQLGCQFCLANLEDLKRQDAKPTGAALRDRILQSTIGFLHQSYLGTQNNGRS